MVIMYILTVPVVVVLHYGYVWFGDSDYKGDPCSVPIYQAVDSVRAVVNVCLLATMPEGLQARTWRHCIAPVMHRPIQKGGEGVRYVRCIAPHKNRNHDRWDSPCRVV